MKKEVTVITKLEKDNVARIILNDPATYNALSLSTLKSLINSFDRLNENKKTKVIIIEGMGKGFSAGHNLKEIKLLKGKPEYKKLFSLCSKLMLSITNNSLITSKILLFFWFSAVNNLTMLIAEVMQCNFFLLLKKKGVIGLIISTLKDPVLLSFFEV